MPLIYLALLYFIYIICGFYFKDNYTAAPSSSHYSTSWLLRAIYHGHVNDTYRYVQPQNTLGEGI